MVIKTLGINIMLITLGGVSVVQPPSYGLALLITEKKTNFYFDYILWVFKCIKKPPIIRIV